MSEIPDFDESTAAYNDPVVFIQLWNKMDVVRRHSNTGLFATVFGRVPSESEIALGITPDSPLNPTPAE